MDDSGIDVAQVMKGQRGGVTDNGHATAPKSPPDQVTLVVFGPLLETKNAAVNPYPIAGVNVVLLRLVRVADVDRLRRCEVAVLYRREARKASPKCDPLGHHANTITQN